MNGTAILVIAALIALCLVGIAYTIHEMVKLEELPQRRQVERTVFQADWDRILIMTQLKKAGEGEKESTSMDCEM